MQQLIAEITKEQLRTDLPEFRPGDTVSVHVKVVEGTRERIQVFEGVVIKRQDGGISETFTVSKISYGVGVERTFPVHSPRVAKIEVIRHGIVRRAKLYYLRKLRGKTARIKEIVANLSNSGRRACCSFQSGLTISEYTKRSLFIRLLFYK